MAMTASELNLYLAMLDKKAHIWRAKRILHPDDENALINLRKVDQFVLKAIHQYHNG
jgi:hypothetical protein